MSDPERLLSKAKSPIAKSLLSAARDEQPSEAVLERTLLAVGAGSALLGANAGASAATAAASTAAATSAKASGILAAAKWLGMGALGGALLTTVAYETREALRPPAKAVPAPAVATAVPAPRPAEPPAANVAPPPAEQPPVDTSTSAGAAAAAPTKTQSDRSLALAAEVAALDAARQALSTGDTGRALALLDAYRDRFPDAHLLPEALHIRMEALYARGDRAGAARIAERLLAGFPRSPHVARARRIADEARR